MLWEGIMTCSLSYSLVNSIPADMYIYQPLLFGCVINLLIEVTP